MRALSLILLFISFQACSSEQLPALPENQEQAVPVVPVPSPLNPDPQITKKIRFAVIADLNGSFGSTNYSQDVKSAVRYIADKENKIDFVISAGDMVAGQKSNLDYRAMWDAFHTQVTRPLKAKKIPIFPSPGNHDAAADRSIERGHYKRSWDEEKSFEVATNLKFVKGVEQNYPFKYAFTVESALFVSLDNTAPRAVNSSQLKWLEEVLEKNKSLKTKIIYGHIPMLPFAFKKETEYMLRGRASALSGIEGLLEKYNVTAFISGHSHVYYPGKRKGRTQFISVPLLGGGPRFLITEDQNENRSEHGFLVMEYSTDKSLSFKSLRSDDYTEVHDDTLPSFLSLPSRNGGKCKRCEEFPESLFMDKLLRSVYLRRDQ